MSDPTTWVAQPSPKQLARPMRPILVPAHDELEPSRDGITVNPFLVPKPAAWCCPCCGLPLLTPEDFNPAIGPDVCPTGDGGYFRHDRCIVCDRDAVRFSDHCPICAQTLDWWHEGDKP